MRTILCFLALPLAAWAQLDDNTVTVTASRQLPILQPDQAVFTVYVTSPPDASLDDVLNTLAGVGISASNLTGVSGGSTDTDWTFTLTVPLSKLGPTVAGLNAASASSTRVGYSVYSQVSPALQASGQCPYALLVSDAQAQAQRLASAAGARVGPVVWVSDGSAMPGALSLVAGNFSAAFLYGAVAANRLGSYLVNPQPAAPACTMAVQFSLLN
jgi:Protein of unknown function (DUF541)